VTHSLPDLLAQRIIAIALVYEDVEDHDDLRNEPWSCARATCRPFRRWAAGAGLHRRRSPLSQIRRKDDTTSGSLCRAVRQKLRCAPDHITLDINAADIKTHGHQAGVVLTVMTNIAVSCPSCLIRTHWSKVKILIRGDSGFARRNLMNWCEANRVDYIFGLPRNTWLSHKACKIRSHAAVAMVDSDAPVQAFGHFSHRPNPEADHDRDRSSAKPCIGQLTTKGSAFSSPLWTGTPRW
jgi:hypothetical protein